MPFDRSKAHEVSDNGLLLDSAGSLLTSGSAAPSHSGLKGDFYFRTLDATLWRLAADGTAWARLASQDITFSPVTGIVGTTAQAAIEAHGTRHSPGGADSISLPNSQAYASATTTTTSATDVALDSMSITPGAGTYLVIFITSLLSSTNGSIITTSIYANNVQVANTEITSIPRDSNSSSNRLPIMNTGIATVADGQAIAIRWRRTAGTATAYNRKLQLVRIA